MLVVFVQFGTLGVSAPTVPRRSSDDLTAAAAGRALKAVLRLGGRTRPVAAFELQRSRSVGPVGRLDQDHPQMSVGIVDLGCEDVPVLLRGLVDAGSAGGEG